MNEMQMFPALDIAGSGMGAEARRLEVVAANIANARTLETDRGEPYRRREVIFRTVFDRESDRRSGLAKVEVKDVVEDMSEFPRVFRGKDYPGADEEGYVRMPNVDMVYEMVDLMSAMRAFQANLKSSETFKSMAEAALRIGR